MKACLITRKSTKDCLTRENFTDYELEQCGFLKYGSIHEIEELTTDLCDELLNKFERLNSLFGNANYEVVEME